MFFLKVAALLADLSWLGRSFHACGPEWEKARSPNSVESRGLM